MKAWISVLRAAIQVIKDNTADDVVDGKPMVASRRRVVVASRRVAPRSLAPPSRAPV